MSTGHGISLREAQRLILENCTALPEEIVPLAESLHRFPATSLKALTPLPAFDGSLRDGYAISDPSGVGEWFHVVDEVAAGDTRKLRLAVGEAIHIMTGGLIPFGCRGVVPQEQCRLEGDQVIVPGKFLGKSGFFIHARGSSLRKHRVIVPRGTHICSEQQIDLASVGYAVVSVLRRPRVHFFCSGSELVSGTDSRLQGEKFSANPALLQGLLGLCGTKFVNHGNVADDPRTVTEMFDTLLESNADVIVSTGGMGPGRYDLVEDAFVRIGGRVIYRSLQLRPGKSTLFGTVAGKLFFGMPGPPPAVMLLFHELIRPALLRLQGAGKCLPAEVRAYLTTELPLRKRGLARLKSAALLNVDGSCQVRPCRHGEAANAYIYCPPGRRMLRKNEKVRVHLLGEGLFTSVSPNRS